MDLFIELGNSSVKLQAVTDQGLLAATFERFYYVDTASLLSHLERTLKDMPVRSYSCILIVSVLPVSTNAHVETLVFSVLGLRALVINAPLAEFALQSRYERNALGVDRWLHLWALAESPRASACLLVSCGTALTLDYVDVSGVHQGGYICSGLQLSQDCLRMRSPALSSGYARYQASSEIPFGVWPVNTFEAVAWGAFEQACGVIESIYAQCAKDQPVNLVLTGGDADLIAQALPMPSEIRPHLLFEGLMIISKRLN